MRIKEGFVLRKVADSAVIVSLQEMDCTCLMTLNESGVELWEALEKGADLQGLTSRMLELYNVSEETARNDAASFVEKLRKAGLLDE